MSEIVGGLGEGRVLVFQPATPTGLGLYVALGIQRLWQKTLQAAGRPAACIVANTRVESIHGETPEGFPMAVGDKGVLPIKDWSDDAANAALVQQHECRWGLVSTLIAHATSARLETALFEAKPSDAMRTIATWTFEGEGMPEHVCVVLLDVARRLGTKLPWAHAWEAFDTADVPAAMRCLEMMGITSTAEDGCRFEIQGVLDRLLGLVEAAPRSKIVLALVPELLGHLARLGAHDLQLAGWLRRARESIGALPREWDGMLDEIRGRRT